MPDQGVHVGTSASCKYCQASGRGHAKKNQPCLQMSASYWQFSCGYFAGSYSHEDLSVQ